MAVALRPYRPVDAPALLALFRNTIRQVNSQDYTPAQIAAWAADDVDTAAWADRFAGRFAVVAEEGGRPVGFADLRPDGYLDRLFAAADRQRRGVGGRLLNAVLAEARWAGLSRVFVEASVTARPFFEGQGFLTLARQEVTCRGVTLVNFRMELVLPVAIRRGE